MLACLLFMGGGNLAWAEEQTATLTFSSACGGSGTDDKDNSWTVTSDASESTYDGTKGIHYGTGSAAVSYLTLTNSSITGTISKIVVNASGASKTSAKIDVKVGGSAFGSQQSLTSSNAAYTFNGSASGNIEISLTQTSATKALYVKSVAVTYSTAADTRTAVNITSFSATSTTLTKGDNATTTITNDQSDWTPAYTYESSNTNVATVSNDGVITAVAKGTATITASLNIANDDANWKKGATTSKTIDITVNNPSHNYTFYSNGTSISSGSKEEGETITFPTDDPKVDGVVFMGWATDAIDGTQDNAPSFVNTATEIMGTDDVTYYAVFALQDGEPAQETKTQTLQYDTWTYSGSTTDKSSYRLFHSGSYIESASFDRSKLAKVIVYGGTFGGDSYNKLTIGDGTNTWKSVTVSGSSQTGVNTYTNGTALTGTGTIRITSNSGSASSNGVRISKVEIFTMEGGYTYSNYCTTVALDPKPTIVLSATELAEYAGNNNTSITVSVSDQNYTGTLEASSDKEDVATASISEGTITINALTAGSATITITAPAITGFRKNTATIAVTVSEKLAHGLAFDAEVLNLTVGQTEITEPTLSNPNSLPVVYSLVYATLANEGKVATINAETGKITLADPSLSTETQGAVTVKASTVGDNSHAAGEVTYNLVVARKVTTTSWSNGGAAVNIDKDEIATLPTATNDGNRNIAYESSNEGVAKFVEGVLTFVDYGTTTITAKTSATAEYAATSATYELTFAPRYTVTFNVNGNETQLREETSGAGVTAPSVDPIEGKVFRGWAEAKIDETQDDAPEFVTTTSLDEDKTLYAVFADMTPGAEGSVVFDLKSITDISTSNAERRQTTDDITFTFSSVSTTNVSGTQYVQMAKSSTLTQSDAFAANIKSITFEGFGYSSTSNASMLVEGKKGNGEYATVQSCGSSYTGAEISFGSNEYDFFKITVGSERTVKFTKMTVSYSGITYSGYCTTVKTTPTLSFANPTYNAILEEEFTAPALTNPETVTVSYTSDDEDVATVDRESGAITLVGLGTTTITASFAGNERYNEASASYELVVAATLTLVAKDGDDYYATFSNANPVQFDEATTVYTVSVSGPTISLYEVDSKKVPANTGVLIKSTNNNKATYTLIESAEAFTGDNANNRLMPGAATVTADPDHTYYRLAYYTKQEGLGFYYVVYTNESKSKFYSKVGGAYLDVETPMTDAPARFVIGAPQTPTDIENIAEQSAAQKVLINGQVFILRGEKLYDTVGRLVK